MIPAAVSPTEKLRQIRRFLFQLIVDTSLVLDFALNGGDADDLVVNTTASLLPMFASVKRPKRRRLLREGGFHFQLILTGSGVAQLASGDDGIAGQQIPALGSFAAA
jgi:hypothetical protein